MAIPRLGSRAQDRMERARSHRDELASQVRGYWDIDSEPPDRLRRLLRFAQDELDARRREVAEEYLAEHTNRGQ